MSGSSYFSMACHCCDLCARFWQPIGPLEDIQFQDIALLRYHQVLFVVGMHITADNTVTETMDLHIYNRGFIVRTLVLPSHTTY